MIKQYYSKALLLNLENTILNVELMSISLVSSIFFYEKIQYFKQNI